MSLDPRDPSVRVDLTPDAEPECATCVRYFAIDNFGGRCDLIDTIVSGCDRCPQWECAVVLNAPTEAVLAEFAKDEAIERARCVKAHEEYGDLPEPDDDERDNLEEVDQELFDARFYVIREKQRRVVRKQKHAAEVATLRARIADLERERDRMRASWDFLRDRNATLDSDMPMSHACDSETVWWCEFASGDGETVSFGSDTPLAAVEAAVADWSARNPEVSDE